MGQRVGIFAGFMAALLISGGLAASGWFVGKGIVQNRTADRFVTVKGLAERDVIADLAVWPITIVASGDALEATQSEIETDIAALTNFLVEAGFTREEIALGRIQVEDRIAMGYYDPNRTAARYLIRQPVRVRSDKVELVEQMSRRLGDVVRQGVVMQDWQGPSYIFSRLNDIKPEMLAEATANARDAAQQFADDSGAALGGIRTANQGVFVILPRDRVMGANESEQVDKTVRVVATITYMLDQ